MLTRYQHIQIVKKQFWTPVFYNITIVFLQKANIKSIINLQTPGEHASCGPNLQHVNGFTYDPNEFMSQDIFYYNFAWKDYGEAHSMIALLDMVKVS